MSPEPRKAFQDLAGRMQVRWEDYEEDSQRAQEYDEVSHANGMSEPSVVELDNRGGIFGRVRAILRR
jgi:hypothetical protein